MKEDVLIIEIYYVNGQKVMHVENDFSVINIEKLNPGVYFLKIKGIASEKFFKIIKK